jgi:hypothetical protein
MRSNYKIVSGDFEGNFYTHQRAALTATEWNSAIKNHEIHLYRGELWNIQEENSYEPESYRNRNSLLLHNVTDVQFHLPVKDDGITANRIFNFDQLLLQDAVVKESWDLNGKTYGIISGKLLGKVKEEVRRNDPSNPVPPTLPPDSPPPPTTVKTGPVLPGCLSSIWRLLLALLLLLFILWFLKGCWGDHKANLNCCVERDSLSEKLSKANSENDSLLHKVILLQDSLLKCKDENTKYREIEERRRKRGGKIGALTFTLIWDTRDDLDLMVTDPAGERIFFKYPRGSNGGILDIDANRCFSGEFCDDLVEDPVENIFWLNNPPSGTYLIEVQFYNNVNPRTTLGEVPFYVEVLENGESISFEGTVTKESKSVTFMYKHLGY